MKNRVECEYITECLPSSPILEIGEDGSTLSIKDNFGKDQYPSKKYWPEMIALYPDQSFAIQFASDDPGLWPSSFYEKKLRLPLIISYKIGRQKYRATLSYKDGVLEVKNCFRDPKNPRFWKILEIVRILPQA